MTTGVFLLDDHEVVRRGVRDLLGAQPDISVIGEAGTRASALARIPAAAFAAATFVAAAFEKRPSGGR